MRYLIRYSAFVLTLLISLNASADSSAAVGSQSDEATINMLDYLAQHIDPVPRDTLEKKIEPYDRQEHFGPWVKGLDPSRTCLDTRAVILIRDEDSSTPVQYHDAGSCTVLKGLWDDPYTGTQFKAASAIQIDHVVPLKNAYLSGAYDWDPSRRCTYANFLSDDYHLLAVSGHENMKKGDRGPEGYVPPNDAYVCHYLNIWMKIKTEWELNVSPDEYAAIEKLLQTKNCDPSDAQISASELNEVRAKSQTPIAKCVDFGHVSTQSGGPSQQTTH